MVSKLGVRDVVAAVAASARRWSDRAYAPRRSACLQIAARTGYAEAVVETALDRLFAPIEAAVIEATVIAELGSLEVLDDFVVRPGAGRVRALPIGRVCIVSSRTTIGVAIVPALFALCAGCEVLVKDREDRLVEAFFTTLREVEPALAGRAAAMPWHGETDAVDLGTFDSVVAFGSNDTLATIARGLPLQTHFIPYGTAASAGYIGAETLDNEARARTIARDASRDALLYDGEGCMSLHVLFVASSGRISPSRFAELLRDAFAETGREYPASHAPAAAARRALERDAARLHASQCVLSDDGASYLLVAGSSNGSPPLLTPRALNLVVVNDQQEAAEYLQRYGITLEALAVSEAGGDYFKLARACGAARITPFGSMQAPPPGNPHGGRPRIAEFVRWIADET
jgi:hypothetical protein